MSLPESRRRIITGYNPRGYPFHRQRQRHVCLLGTLMTTHHFTFPTSEDTCAACRRFLANPYNLKISCSSYYFLFRFFFLYKEVKRFYFSTVWLLLKLILLTNDKFKETIFNIPVIMKDKNGMKYKRLFSRNMLTLLW